VWLKIDDGLPQSVKVRGLAAPLPGRPRPLAPAERAKRDRNSALGAWAQISAWAAGERTDGFVPASVVDDYATPEDVARLTRARFGRAPMLHTLGGGACRCFEGRRWPEGADYALHDYLDRNPTRADHDVAKAQRRELRDRELRAQIRRRDGDACRYCGTKVNWNDRRSATGGVLEHVRPDLAGGADNLVVACRGCNSRKGKRTPEAAGMTLRPAPGAPATRDQPPPDLEPIHGSAPDPTRNGPATGSSAASDPPDPSRTPHPAPFGALVPAQAARGVIYDGVPDATCSAGTDVPGRRRDGPPALVDRDWPALDDQRPRTALAGNPYLRSALTGPAPDEHAGLLPAEANP
jgi:5-methylcytosine-specific restriction endonuclease McrA